MNQNHGQVIKKWGLLANGSSGPWSIDIDESQDGAAYNMQIDGPHTYLSFALRDLQVVPRLLGYLIAGLRVDSNNEKRIKAKNLALGRVGSVSVSIIQDDETPLRWFIIIKGKAAGVVRLALDAAECEMLVEALTQVVEDLPDA